MKSIIGGDNYAGEFPEVPKGDGKPTYDRISEIMRRKLLTGEWASNGGADDKLIRAFRESGLSVDKFIAKADKLKAENTVAGKAKKAHLRKLRTAAYKRQKARKLEEKVRKGTKHFPG
jgi:GTP-binding protein EngB required for normal cell division